jgi:hypothetical protein
MRHGFRAMALRRGQADDAALLVNGFFIFVCLRGFKLYRFREGKSES